MMPEVPSQVITKSINRLLIAVVVLYLILAATGIYFFIRASHDRQAIAENTERLTKAACIQLAQAKSSLQDSQEFLSQHPEGLPNAGITPALILRGQKNNLRTIRALSFVKCPPEKLG